ncbi:MAG: class I SAM-dependent methyltransferase [Methylococcales bacterium]|nr:class I SAM-dependent methyltransferase [Methylococcales bacterium]
MTNPIYDQIGLNYSKYRKADRRIVQMIINYLDVPVNGIIGDVGAGTGNYSQAIAEEGYKIKCIEPSGVMLSQKKMHQNIKWIIGDAEKIPLETKSMDAVMAILAFHHFYHPEKAIEEMARVSKGNIVLFTFDPREVDTPWIADYFPEVWEEAFAFFSPLSEIKKQIESVTDKKVTSHVFELPHDLTDYFAAAGWRRPEMYLDPIVRSCMSAFAVVNQNKIEQSVKNLKQDLESGHWENQYGYLNTQESFDAGYRFIVSS